MKKRSSLLLLVVTFFAVLMTVSSVSTMSVFAEGEDSSSSTNEEELLGSGSLESDGRAYDPNKVNIYMFRGRGCTVCARALEFFNSIEEEYGDHFNLITYEVYFNQENAQLMDDVASYLNTSATGVPFILVGDEIFPGFGDASSTGQEILDEIEEQYAKPASERDDLMNDYNDKKDQLGTEDFIILGMVAILGVGIVLFVIFSRKGTKDENKSEPKKDVEEEIVLEDELETEEVVKAKTSTKPAEKKKVNSEKKSPSTKSKTTKGKTGSTENKKKPGRPKTKNAK